MQDQTCCCTIFYFFQPSPHCSTSYSYFSNPISFSLQNYFMLFNQVKPKQSFLHHSIKVIFNSLYMLLQFLAKHFSLCFSTETFLWSKTSFFCFPDPTLSYIKRGLDHQFILITNTTFNQTTSTKKSRRPQHNTPQQTISTTTRGEDRIKLLSSLVVLSS